MVFLFYFFLFLIVFLSLTWLLISLWLPNVVLLLSRHKESTQLMDSMERHKCWLCSFEIFLVWGFVCMDELVIHCFLSRACVLSFNMHVLFKHMIWDEWSYSFNGTWHLDYASWFWHYSYFGCSMDRHFSL